MVGFASAGSGFTTQIREENVWIFNSFSLLLSASRCLLGWQYLVAGRFLQKAMPVAARELTDTSLLFYAASFTYAIVSPICLVTWKLPLTRQQARSYLWILRESERIVCLDRLVVFVLS
jgi:hypothetical protein